MTVNTSNTIKPKGDFLTGNPNGVSDKQKIKQAKIDNAQALLDKYGYFGGKRLLGKNSNGTEVWISFKATEDTIEVTTTHEIDSVLPENGGQLAAERVSWFLTKKNERKMEFMYYDGDKGKLGNLRRHGLITKNTILHLSVIIDELRRFTVLNKKPPRDLYRLLAWNIFNSTFNDSSYPGTNWDYCADIQGYRSPEGYYFTGQI